MLKKGMLADFVLLSDNLLTIDPLKIDQAQALKTFVGGKEMYVKSK